MRTRKRVGNYVFTITIDVLQNIGIIEFYGHPVLEQFMLFSPTDHVFRWRTFAIGRVNTNDVEGDPPKWIFLHHGKKVSVEQTELLILRSLLQKIRTIAQKLERQHVPSTPPNVVVYEKGDEVTAIINGKTQRCRVMEVDDGFELYAFDEEAVFRVGFEDIASVIKVEKN